MKKASSILRESVSVILFVALFLILLNRVTDILIPKTENRYYILQKYLEENPEENEHDVMVFGSCHAYTSFNPICLQDDTDIDSFVYANSSEIIPMTYVRMVEQFSRHVPKVAVVEIWGINPYETYLDKEEIFEEYLPPNLENASFSAAKMEVIRDFSSDKNNRINFLSMNFPIVTYKDRILDGSLTKVDFSYSYEGLEPYSKSWCLNEMNNRLMHKGYVAYTSSRVADYPVLQAHVGADDRQELEPLIEKYVRKIIDLCKKKGVELIFYRAPYVSTANELRKVNYFEMLCEENGVTFIDLEKEIEFDYNTDFFDTEHLSMNGAKKATTYLTSYIQEALDKQNIS